MSPPTILILGASGQVGGELVRLVWHGAEVVAPTREEADLLKLTSIADAVARYRPAIVINAAADTAVDRAEAQSDLAQAANVEAPAALALASQQVGARLIHFSTDYVFSGERETPYAEDDPAGPVNAYGKFKLEGEQRVLAADARHLVFRLSWVYGVRGRNFALTMLRLAREGKPIRVVDDQIGSPTYARYIAESVGVVAQNLLAKPEADGGLFHLSAGGSTSWHGFASALLRQVFGDESPPVEPIPTSAFPTPARRPRYSVLGNAKVEARFGVRLPDWQAQCRSWANDLSLE